MKTLPGYSVDDGLMEGKKAGRDTRREAAARIQQGAAGGLNKAVKLGIGQKEHNAQESDLTNSGEGVSMTEGKAATSKERLDHKTSTILKEYLHLICTSTREYENRSNKKILVMKIVSSVVQQCSASNCMQRGITKSGMLALNILGEHPYLESAFIPGLNLVEL